MYPDLKGKSAVITGSGKRSGIGYAIAEKLASCGAHVVIADLGHLAEDSAVKTGTTDEMNEIAEDLSKRYEVRALPAVLDVTDPEAISALAAKVQTEFGQLNILCNNAGNSFGVPNMVTTYDEEAWMKTIDVNLHSVFRLSRALLPMMFGQPGATIINTSSRAGKVAPVFNGAYAVAKAGVLMLTKVMAMELAQAGVRVNAICPGQIMTDLERWRFGLEAQAYGGTVEDRIEEMKKNVPMAKIGEPADVANVVAFLASEESSYMTGQALNICGGQTMAL